MSLLSLFGAVPSSQQSLAPDVFDDYWYEPRGLTTVAGVRVNEFTAFNYSVCWAATRLLAGTAGWLPFNLHKRLANGGAEIDTTHHVHRLIHSQPNNDMGAMMFRARGVNHQVNWGNTFNEIVRTNGGVPLSLEPIHPSRIPAQNIKRENGRLVYYVNQPRGEKQERILQENMFHVPSIISDDGIIGKGVITAARESIGKAMGTQARGSSALKQGGAPPLALKLKGGRFKTKEDREEFRRQINQVHGGPDNAGKWLMLPEDADVQMLGYSLHDSQFIESEQFDIEEMSRWYGVPPHLVGHLLRATFNNIEELGISFVKYSLILWLKLWEQEVWRKLLTNEEKQTHYAKFNVDALERGNLATRTEAGVKKFFNGLWTLNQWAEQEDMNPITATAVVDGQTVNLGDINFVQQAMIPLASAAKGPAQTQQQGADGPNVTEDLKVRMDAYGVGVRAGAITPQTDDEEQFRQESGLPPMSDDAKEAWAGDGGVRHPITLRDPNAPATPFGQPKEPEPEDDGLSAARKEIAELREQIAAAPHGMNGEAQQIRESQKQLAGAMLRDVMAQMISLEVNAVKRVAEKPSRFDVRLREFYDKHKLTMERSLLGPFNVLAQLSPDAPVDSIPRLTVFVSQYCGESLRQLDALCDCTADQLEARVEECVSKWHEERATVTA